MTTRGPMSEDPEFRLVSAPESYPKTTSSAVRYVPVRRGDRELGYLWVSVDDDAAGFVWRPDQRPDSFNTGQVWVKRLRAAKAEGLTPAELLQRWVGHPEDEGGHVPTGAEQTAPGLDALKALAGH
jgi:hypothetical protein